MSSKNLHCSLLILVILFLIPKGRLKNTLSFIFSVVFFIVCFSPIQDFFSFNNYVFNEDNVFCYDTNIIEKNKEIKEKEVKNQVEDYLKNLSFNPKKISIQFDVYKNKINLIKIILLKCELNNSSNHNNYIDRITNDLSSIYLIEKENIIVLYE